MLETPDIFIPKVSLWIWALALGCISEKHLCAIIHTSRTTMPASTSLKAVLNCGQNVN